ncbi:MAG: MATE family efflux transporter [Treponema sp.]|nr:MATE family efflux transporter [Treponema sp.]
MSNVNSQVKENKLGTMPIGRLLVNVSLPIMISMLVQALYNIVDSIFVSRIDEGALTAVSLAFPIQNLMISVGIGTAVGINAILSMRLGQKNYEQVSKTAMNGLFLAFCSFVVFAVSSFFVIDPYLASQTADAKIIGYSKSYLSIVMLMSFGMFFGITFDRLLQSTGKTIFTMITQLVGAVTNIVLDPLLIFGIGPFPRMGIAGAALATVLGQIFGLVFSVIFNLKVNKEISFVFKGFKPDPVVIGQIYKIGVPSILVAAVGSVTTYGFNIIFKGFKGIADTAIAVYGSYFKLNSFIFMPVFGLTNGMVAIVAYNYGAQSKSRILKTVKIGLLAALTIMLIGTAAFELIPHVLLGFFNASDVMLSIGIPALRIIATSFWGAAIAISLGCIFQALGDAFYSMINSIIRQVVVLLPVAFLLSLTGNINNVWWCFPIAEVFSVGLSVIFFIRIYNKKLKHLGE